MRAAPGLVEDDVRPRSFLEQQRVFDSPYGERRHYWKGSFVRELPDELIDELLARIGALDRPGSHVLIESLHGAPKDAEAEHGALRFRHAGSASRRLRIAPSLAMTRNERRIRERLHELAAMTQRQAEPFEVEPGDELAWELSVSADGEHWDWQVSR